MINFLVPPGIGDFSAMYAKLAGIKRPMTIIGAGDNPQRLGPFLDILPNIQNGGYGSFTANTSLLNTIPAGTDLASLADGDYFLAINNWLESGKDVDSWVPGPIDYHYLFNRPTSLLDGASGFLDGLPEGPKVGIYCSAYGNSRHWGFWGPNEWREFLELLRVVLPKNTNYIFIGAEYDVQIAESLYAWMTAVGHNAWLTLGSFHIAGTIEVISALDYFFVFPSGLGFLADVVDTPHVMWFPPHLKPMMGTFVDPDNYGKRTIHGIFTTPQKAFEDFQRQGLQYIGSPRVQRRNGTWQKP